MPLKPAEKAGRFAFGFEENYGCLAGTAVRDRNVAA